MAQAASTDSAPARPALPLFAVVLVLGATCCNTLEFTLVHALGPGWPAPLQLFWRQGVGLLLLMPLILRDPVGYLKVSRPGLLLFRSICAMSGLLLSIYAFSHLDIAVANALTFTRPLFIIVLAAVMLGEKVGIWRGAAVLLGFGGVLVMLDPTKASHDWLPEGAILLAALLFAASFVSIKSMTSDNRTTTIVIYGMVFGLLLSAGPAYAHWRTPDWQQAALLAGLGFTSLGAFTFFANALRMADVSALVSFDYLRLPLVTAIGYWLFDEWPGGSLYIGAAMIVTATVIVTLRERSRKARA